MLAGQGEGVDEEREADSAQVVVVGTAGWRLRGWRRAAVGDVGDERVCVAGVTGRSEGLQAEAEDAESEAAEEEARGDCQAEAEADTFRTCA